VGAFLAPIFEPGFFGNSPVHVALIVGAVVAVVSGPVGVFTVLRGQSFAGHALSDVGATGGSGAFLLGINPLWGFVGMGLAAAGAMEVVGVRRPRGRDLATGVVFGASLGLAALFLFWDTHRHTTSGVTVNLLFGDIWVIVNSTVVLVAAFGAVALGLLVALYRPLLLSSVSPDLAAARGVPVRAVGAAYFAALAIAVSLSSLTIGAILSTALLIGPAASALAVTKKPAQAMVTAALLGVAVTWVGILLSWDSYYWPPREHGWPVSFFIVALTLLTYLVAQGSRRATRRSDRVVEGSE